MGRTEPPYHLPVLASEVAALLQPPRGGVVIDATFGGGGHTRALLAAQPQLRVIGIDRDAAAAARAAELPGVTFLAGNFRNMVELVKGVGVDEVAAVIFDLGVSSHQLDVGDRGLSYHRAGPLDMRLGEDCPLTAEVLVNEWDERSLGGIIRRYGEDPHAGRIAAAIVRARPLHDAAQLAGVIAGAVPAHARRGGHPARRTFQALRIAVNDELGSLADGLEAALSLLQPRGRIAVIAYHSLEDRIVKRRFAAGTVGCVCPPDLPVCGCGRSAELRLLTRRAVTPSEAEVAGNARARSARLRAAEKAEKVAS